MKVSEGSMSKEEFDNSMKDLVNFLGYAAEPARITREKNGVFVILFFIVFTAVMNLFYIENTQRSLNDFYSEEKDTIVI